MWTLTIVLTVLLAAIFPATQILRDIVDARRVRERDYGGTGDIAIWSIAITLILIVADIICLCVLIVSVRR